MTRGRVATPIRSARDDSSYERLPCASNPRVRADSNHLMWLLVARTPSPDAAYWPGRRWLAAVDAIGWPLLWTIAVLYAPRPVGVIGPVVASGAALLAVGRLRRALWHNQRYRFTTWRWGRVVVALLMLGVLLKLTVPQ